MKGQSLARSTSSERESSIISRRQKIAAKMEIPETPNRSEMAKKQAEQPSDSEMKESSSKSAESFSKAPVMSMQTSPSKKGSKSNSISSEAAVRTPETGRVAKSNGDLIITLPNIKSSSRKNPTVYKSEKLFSPDNADQVLARTTRSKVSEGELDKKAKVNGKSPQSTRSASAAAEKTSKEPENVTPKSETKKRLLSPSSRSDAKRKKLGKLSGKEGIKDSNKNSGPIMMPRVPNSSRVENELPNGVSTRAESRNARIQYSRKFSIRNNKLKNKTFLPKLSTLSSFAPYKGYKIPKNSQSSEGTGAVKKEQENGEAESKLENSECEADELTKKPCNEETDAVEINSNSKTRRSTGEVADRNGNTNHSSSTNGSAAMYSKATNRTHNAQKFENNFCSQMSLTTRNYNNNIDVSQPTSKHLSNNLFDSLIYDCDSTVASDGELGGATGATYVIARSSAVASDSAILSKIQQEIAQSEMLNNECHVIGESEFVTPEVSRASIVEDEDEVILPDSTTPDIEMIVSKNNKSRSSVSDISSVCQPTSPAPFVSQDLGILNFRDESFSPPDVSSSVPLHSEMSCGIEINEDSTASTDNLNQVRLVEEKTQDIKAESITSRAQSPFAVSSANSECGATVSLESCEIDVFEIDSTSSPEHQEIEKFGDQSNVLQDGSDYIDTKTAQLASENDWRVEDTKLSSEEIMKVEEIDYEPKEPERRHLLECSANSIFDENTTTSTLSLSTDAIKEEDNYSNKRDNFSFLQPSFGRPKPISLQMSPCSSMQNFQSSQNNSNSSSIQRDLAAQININVSVDNSSHLGAPKSDSAYNYSDQLLYGSGKVRATPFSVNSSPRSCNSGSNFSSIRYRSPDEFGRNNAHSFTSSSNEESSEHWINWGKSATPSSAPPSTSNGSSGNKGSQCKSKRKLDRRHFFSRSFHNDGNRGSNQSAVASEEEARTKHCQSSGIIVTSSSQSRHSRFDRNSHKFSNNF